MSARLIYAGRTGVQGRRRLGALVLATLLLAAVFGFSILNFGHAGGASASVAQPHHLSNSNMSLQVTGIPGDGTVKNPLDIQVLSYSWGQHNQGALATGVLKAGKASFSDLSVSIAVSKASPLLAKACAMGQALAVSLFIDPTSPGGDSAVYILTNAHVSSVSDSGSGEPAFEDVSFSYQKIVYNYTSASTAKVTHFGWDLGTNKSI